VHERTGFDAEVASFSANPFTGLMLVRGLVVANPATFPARDFVQVRSFEADLGWWSLLSERLVIESLTVDVRQVTLLKRANGPTNLEVFRSGLAGPGPKTAATPPPMVIKRLQGGSIPWLRPTIPARSLACAPTNSVSTSSFRTFRTSANSSCRRCCGVLAKNRML